jgi:branched-chain amino acid aminotransferase
LTQGALALGIRLPWTDGQTQNLIEELSTRNELPNCVLRITLTRGRGLRGYSPKGAGEPSMVLTLHPLPTPDPARSIGITLAVSSYRVLAGDPLLQIKSGSQLVRVMARAEAEALGAAESLILNHHGRVAETAGANLFWVCGNVLRTPPISEGALPGITRAAVMELCPGLEIECVEAETSLEDLKSSNGVFLTNSGWGVVEAIALDGAPLARSVLAGRIIQAYGQNGSH